MSLGLFNCRLIQPAGDQLFFFAGCLASSGKLCSVSFVTHPARPRPAGGRSMLLVFPSQKGFVWVFQRGRSPRRVQETPTDSATNSHEDPQSLSLIHISEPTRQAEISYAVFCLK